MPNNKIHEGRNVKRFREMLGIKQDALAFDLCEQAGENTKNHFAGIGKMVEIGSGVEKEIAKGS